MANGGRRPGAGTTARQEDAQDAGEGAGWLTKVLEGLGYGLDENARAALKQFRFRPGMKDGKPVDVAFVAKINFHIPPR
jgi:hypothetical protein